jgi:nitrate reductase gamma subunit
LVQENLEREMSDLHNFVFGIYPYIALAVFLLGSLVRFEREPYTWKSDSSQLLRRGQLRLGNNLFHIGILALFFGHLFGLLTPKTLYNAIGLTTAAKQMLAIVAGGVFGTMCLVGLILLVHRRLAEPRIRATSTRMDIVILLWILATLLLGLTSIFFSLGHPDGSVMVQLGNWAQHIMTLRGGAATFIADVHWIYKVHLVFGMTVFVLFPFSRLVHIWSGFASVRYLTRAYQVVRSRG